MRLVWLKTTYCDANNDVQCSMGLMNPYPQYAFAYQVRENR